MRTVALLSAILMAGVAARQDAGGSSDAARRAWAQAVQAKGGEGALRGIRNFVITESDNRPRSALSGPRVTVVVCEPPAKWWEFADYRPGQLGVSSVAVNRETHEEWYSYGGKASRGRRENTNIVRRMAEYQYVYFLETAALQPTPVSVAVRDDLDVVQAEVLGGRVDFHFDRRSHLLVHVERWVNTRRYWYTLERYEKVGDIVVPTRVGLGPDYVDTKAEVNLDLDPALFSTPPDDVTQPDYWRRFLRQRTGGK